MPEILLDIPIAAAAEDVYAAISTPAGLDAWWTDDAHAETVDGQMQFDLFFGPEYHWRADVVAQTPPTEFTLRMTRADEDWTGTLVHFRLDATEDLTWLRFSHSGWPSVNEHFRIFAQCWAQYLRLLRRYLERGEVVPYHDRLDA